MKIVFLSHLLTKANSLISNYWIKHVYNAGEPWHFRLKCRVLFEGGGGDGDVKASNWAS